MHLRHCEFVTHFSSLLLELMSSHWVVAETLYRRDDALLDITYVILIWAASMPADRWHCSLWP